MGFSFTATAQCDHCGELLNSSDEDCDHDGATVEKYVFRKLGGGRATLVGVETTPRWKWYRLAEKVGDDWKQYQYIAPKPSVNTMLRGSIYESVEELPHMKTAVDAPSDVES